ncbi:hypothetical protein ABPG75_010367 [Micractinium tetrahymenae]
MELAGMGRPTGRSEQGMLRAAGGALPSRLPPRRRCGAGGSSGPRPRRQRSVAPTRAQALPQQLLGAAARAAAAPAVAGSSLASSLASAIDPGVLAATISASGKLLLICGAVGWLLRTGRILNSTATVMSQVSFQLLIPCMLFSKVAATLAAAPDTTLLLGIAAATLFQICAGALCGLVLSPLLGLRQHDSSSSSQGSSSSSASWRGRTSPEAASAIALSMAAASGAPQAAAALRPRQPAPTGGPAQMVAASAAFGNSFTLPAVFLTTLLPAPLADRALGYAALFLLAWSPCLWSIGMALIGGKDQAGGPSQRRQQEQQQQADAAGGGPGAAALAGAGGTGSLKPLAWRQPKAVDVTPLSPSGSSGGSVDGGEVEPPSWVEQLVQHPVTARLGQFASQVLNPPVVAILAGMLVGLTPAGRALLVATHSGTAAAAGAAAAAPAALPPELGLLQAVVKAALEVIELLAAGTLATQTLVLAASLLQQPESQASAAAAAPVGPAASATAAAATALRPRGWLGALRQLLPSDGTEARALAVLVLTRFVALPLATIAALQALVAGGLLPPAMSDPVLLFVLLVESVMPSAQNLIILLQLSERTQGMAPGFARMLLKLYFYAILPVTLWVTSFATNLAIPVLR